MFNICLKGKYENEEQLTKGKALPESAVPFKEPGSVAEVLKKGTLVALPFLFLMVGSMVFRYWKTGFKLQMSTSFMIALVVASLVLFVVIYVHEFIHALLYPMSAEKEVWKMPEQGAFFVYCDAPVSKTRFVVLCLAPAVILGIIPFVIWHFVMPFMPVEWSFMFGMITVMNTYMAVGDYINAYNAIKQVPKNAKIINHGLHSFWME